MHARSTLVPLVAAVVLCVVSAAQPMRLDVANGVITGRIFEATSHDGIPGLVVKLTPPKAEQWPQKITVTDDEGRFEFKGVQGRRYLLEVYQGVTLLYRDVVDSSQEVHEDITLRRK